MDRTKDVPEVEQADREWFADSVWDALKADTNDLRKQQRIIGALDQATRPLTAEIADLRAQLDEAMEALGKAQQWFAEYAESHSEKAKMAGDNEREYEARRKKARTNEQRSEYLRTILAKRKQP